MWGAILIAASLLEQAGLARLATIKKDYKAGKLSIPAALQDALWIPPEPIPNIGGGIPSSHTSDPRCAVYWAAMKAIDLHCGGTGDLFGSAMDQFTEPQQATAADVAEMMREAAGSIPRPE